MPGQHRFTDQWADSAANMNIKYNVNNFNVNCSVSDIMFNSPHDYASKSHIYHKSVDPT